MEFKASVLFTQWVIFFLITSENFAERSWELKGAVEKNNNRIRGLVHPHTATHLSDPFNHARLGAGREKQDPQNASPLTDIHGGDL